MSIPDQKIENAKRYGTVLIVLISLLGTFYWLSVSIDKIYVIEERQHKKITIQNEIIEDYAQFKLDMKDHEIEQLKINYEFRIEHLRESHKVELEAKDDRHRIEILHYKNQIK